MMKSLMSPAGYWKSSFNLRRSCRELLEVNLELAPIPRMGPMGDILSSHTPVDDVRLALVLEESQRFREMPRFST